MASVRMSAQLRDNIVYRAGTIFIKPRERAEKALAEDYADRVMDEIWNKDYKEYVNLIPDSWCVEVDEISGSVRGMYKEKETSHHIDKKLIKSYKLPNLNNVVNWSSDFDITDYPISQSLFDEISKYHARKDKVAREEREFKDHLRATLTKCNTLKQFLDVWPDGEELIPAPVLEKYNTVTPVKAEPKERVDPETTAQLSSILMRRKIGDTIHK